MTPSRCPSCHAVARHLTTCDRDRWRGHRTPRVHPMRPYVMRRGGRWFVLTIESGIVGGRMASCGEANDLGRLWLLINTQAANR